MFILSAANFIREFNKKENFEEITCDLISYFSEDEKILTPKHRLLTI